MRPTSSRNSRRKQALSPAASAALVTAATAGLVLVLVAAQPSSARAAGPETSIAAAALQQAPLTTENVGAAETEAGNLVADAVRAAAGAEIALVPASAFRSGASLSRPVSGAQAASLVEPSDDVLVVLRLSGTQIMDALERSVSFRPQASRAFLQVSGLRFVFDPARPAGKRVVSMTVGGAALDPGRTYSVAMTRSLAAGQQGYFRVWAGKTGEDTGKTLASALRDASRGNVLPAAPPEGRIAAARN